MSEQVLDLRRSLLIVRRHKVIVGIFVALGILAGAGHAALKPPLLVSSALVGLPPTTHDTATQVVIASSDHVLANALRSVDPAMSLQTMRSRVHVKSLTPNLLSISGQGKTAAQAEGIANAVAGSYVAYVRTAHSAVGTVQAQRLEAATNPTGGSLRFHLLVAGGIGAVLGALIGAIAALAIGRTDRRLRERDEIADAIGVPVLASIPVGHPSDAVGWARLIEGYEPRAVHAWSLRKALHHLALTDFRGAEVALSPSSLLPPTREPSPSVRNWQPSSPPGDPHDARHRPPAGRERHGHAVRRVQCDVGGAIRTLKASCGSPLGITTTPTSSQTRWSSPSASSMTGRRG